MPSWVSRWGKPRLPNRSATGNTGFSLSDVLFCRTSMSLIWLRHSLRRFVGHRGMTHSLLFAAPLGVAAGAILGGGKAQVFRNSSLLFLVTASHGLLDAMTNGGLGIAFFSPFDTTRYFFHWRPIQVSPIGIGGFFSARGASILFSETIYVWMPAAIVGLALFNWRWSQESGKPQP